jgi:hypothetical protein
MAVGGKTHLIRIVGGDYDGRYVGPPFNSSGMVTRPELKSSPPVNIPGYGLYVQKQRATRFFEAAAKKAVETLGKLGYSAEVLQSNW